jgi:hypothetical protein
VALGVCFVTDRHKAGFLWVTGDPPRPDDAVVYAETEREIEYVDWQVQVIHVSIHGGGLVLAADRLIQRFGGKAISYSVVLDPTEAGELVSQAYLQ